MEKILKLKFTLQQSNGRTPADNTGFARCGVEGNLRKFIGSTRKNFSIF